MKTTWDYTRLADAYLKRPAYSEEAVDWIVDRAGLGPGDPVCDVGAGTGHLTIPLARRGLRVTAVEPNDSMRANGRRMTEGLEGAAWVEATGEDTRQPERAFGLVSFGSSFNVTDRQAALREAHRILRPGGWFACLWNHRDLDDPVQAAIEDVIRGHIPEYGYGTRREDQTEVIRESGIFEEPLHFQGRTVHEQRVEDCIEAWASHATLQRQAGDAFGRVLEDIGALLRGLGGQSLRIPYTTVVWMARAGNGR